MTVDQIRAFLGWCTVINYGVLVVYARDTYGEGPFSARERVVGVRGLFR